MRLQARLEAQTERLSAALEAPTAESATPQGRAAAFDAHRLQLVRLASEARLRLRHLREGIEDGRLRLDLHRNLLQRPTDRLA